MATSPNATQITPPRVPIIDERTGAVSREWYRWFYSLYNIVGGNLGVIPVSSGGTGLSTIPTNGQLLIGNGTGYTLNTLGTGAGISVTNGNGTITLANTGVLSNIAGTGISVSSATGNVTIANTGVLSFSGGTTGLTPAAATTGAITLAGTLAIANGGTNGSATPTTYGVAYGTGTTYAFTAAGTAKQVLIANTSSAPTWSTLTSGTSILYGDGFGGFSNVTIGSGVSFVAGTLSATGSGGTVTSVTGTSPVNVATGTTTPVISLASGYGDTQNPYASKTANFVLAAPNGLAGVPTFRALVAADVPGSALTKTDDTNVTLTLGGSPTTALLNAASLTLGWTGQLATTRGGTGLGSFTANGVVYASSSSALTTGSAFVFDGTNVGIGNAAPTSPLQIYSATNATILMQGDAAANLTIQRYSTNATQPSVVLFKSRGTLASPTAVATNDQMGSVVFQAYGGTTTRSIGAIRGYVETYTSDTNISSYLWFGTAPAGGTTLTERMRIDSTGAVGIGTTANASAILDAQSTTKGVRFPNMTTVQKNAVAAPAAGLVVFDTTLAKLCVYSGAAWQTITSV